MNKILINLPAQIDTPRLKLLMPQAGFGEILYEAFKDGYEDGVKWLTWPEVLPNAQALEEECRKHHAEFILRDFIRYLIIDKASNMVIGRCAYPSFQAKWNIPQFGISYFIRKTQRSKGYASEAVHALALLAFRTLQAKKLEIYNDAENKASAQVALKLGFKLEYVQKGGWPRPDGELATLQTYALFSEKELKEVG